MVQSANPAARLHTLTANNFKKDGTFNYAFHRFGLIHVHCLTDYLNGKNQPSEVLGAAGGEAIGGDAGSVVVGGDEDL